VKRENKNTRVLFANILESMDGGVIAVDLNGRITFFNRSAEEITGYLRGEALDHECRDILNSDLCQDACPINDIVKSGQPIFNYEVTIKSKTSIKVPVNITTSPLRSGTNEIIGAVVNFRDLTKHEGLWGKLRKERNKAQQYLNIAGVIIVAINNQGLVTLTKNRRSWERTGMSCVSPKGTASQE